MAVRKPAEAPPDEGVPNYRVIHCPNCGNVAFCFVTVDGVQLRECAGRDGCGNRWDAGERGREVVGHRPIEGNA